MIGEFKTRLCRSGGPQRIFLHRTDNQGGYYDKQNGWGGGPIYEYALGKMSAEVYPADIVLEGLAHFAFGT